MKVSIITVTYNSSHTLPDTLESVLHQTYENIELIVVDGCSSDSTIDIIKQYEVKFNGRMRWISERDKGIYDAMNKGILIATGDVVGILNSDDFFSSNIVIERMVKAFTDNIDLVFGDIHFVREDNKHKNIRYYSGKIFRPWLVRWGFVPPHPSFYIRRKIYEQYGYYKDEYNISADFEMIARLCYIKKLPYRYLHLDFVTMRIGGASTQNIDSRLIGAKETLKACHELGIKTNLLMIYCKYLIKTYELLFIRK